MKKYLPRLSLFILILLFTGCVKIDTQVTAKSNGKIDVQSTYDISQLRAFGAYMQDRIDGMNCQSFSNTHPTRQTSCEELPDGNMLLIWKDIDGSEFNAFKVEHKDPIESTYRFDIKAFTNHFKQFTQEQKNILRNLGGSVHIKVVMPGVVSKESAHLQSINGFTLSPYSYDDFTLSSSDFSTSVQFNSAVKRDGLIDMNVKFHKNQLQNENLFDCSLLEKSSFIKPTACTKENNATIMADWENFNGGNFEVLKISYENLFITKYQLNVENLIKNINPNRESYKIFIQNINQSKGEFIVNLKIPGTPVISTDFAYSDGIVKIDLTKYYLYKDIPLIIESTEYNLFMLLFGGAFVLAFIVALVMFILKKQKGEEFYTKNRNKFLIAIGFFIVAGIGCFGYQTYLQQSTHLINTYKKEIVSMVEKEFAPEAPIYEEAPEAAPMATEAVALPADYEAPAVEAAPPMEAEPEEEYVAPKSKQFRYAE